MKNPGIAAVLSFFITGLGQIYNGQIAKGIICVVIWLSCLALTSIIIGWFILPLFWIWGIYDAYRTAERLNAARGPA
jgi:TM2 domain-containing membrane protein YozV